jgi:hypothetical protein
MCFHCVRARAELDRLVTLQVKQGIKPLQHASWVRIVVGFPSSVCMHAKDDMLVDCTWVQTRNRTIATHMFGLDAVSFSFMVLDFQACKQTKQRLMQFRAQGIDMVCLPTAVRRMWTI